MSVLCMQLFRQSLPKRVYFRIERDGLINNGDFIGTAGVMGNRSDLVGFFS